jgi:hypothetical protein
MNTSCCQTDDTVQGKPPYPVQLRLYVRMTLVLFVVSALMITSTLIAAAFLREELATLCICTSNKLVWGWIFLAISMLLSLVSGTAGIFCSCRKPLEQRRFILPYTALLLQTATFITGLIFMILFGAYLLNVIG